mgnify:CR=1 FL=1
MDFDLIAQSLPASRRCSVLHSDKAVDLIMATICQLQAQRRDLPIKIIFSEDFDVDPIRYTAHTHHQMQYTILHEKRYRARRGMVPLLPVEG